MKSGWEVFRISDVANVTSGNSINAQTKRDEYSGLSEGTPYIATKDVGFDHSIDYDNGVLIPEKNLNSFRVIDRDSVLICAEGGSAGRKVAYLERKAVVVNKLFAVSSKGNVHSKFCFYFFLSRGFQEQFENAKTGLIGGVSKRKFVDFTIPLPPLEEQKRIVAVLDAAFEGLDRARAHVEANLQNARDLFECARLKIISGEGPVGENSRGWDLELLKNIVTFHNGDRGKNYPNKSEYVEEGIPWLNTGQILPDGSLNNKKMNFITIEKFNQLGGGKIQLGDLIFCLRGATIGKTAYVSPYETGAIASSLMIIRSSERISPVYLYHFLMSELGREQIDRFIGGAAQPNLAGRSVGLFEIPLPPVSEQSMVIEKLERVAATSQTLSKNYNSKLTDLDDLRQSLLQKAFAGELT